MLYLLQQLLNGLHMGAIYAMLAFGYALINAVLHRTNLAHGAIFGFAGQIMILAAVSGWQVLWLTLPATLAFGVTVALFYGAMISSVLSRSVFLPLFNRSANTIVAATLGVSLVLMELGRIAAETRDFWLPPILSQPVVFAHAGGFKATLTTLQVINCAAVLALLIAASWALPRSRFGREWQAVSDDSSGGGPLRRRYQKGIPASGALRGSWRGFRGHSRRTLLWQYQLRRGAGVRTEDPVRDSGRRLLLATARGGRRCGFWHRRIAMVGLFPGRMAGRLDARLASSCCWC